MKIQPINALVLIGVAAIMAISIYSSWVIASVLPILGIKILASVTVFVIICLMILTVLNLIDEEDYE